MASQCGPDGTDPILQIRRLGKWLGDLQVLRDINLEVRRGEVMVIVGPSGSGKSTLLRFRSAEALAPLRRRCGPRVISAVQAVVDRTLTELAHLRAAPPKNIQGG